MAEQQVSTNKFAVTTWIVDTNGLDQGATHTTVASALTSASSGDVIFIKPGEYTEDITLKSGVNIVGFNGNGFSSVQAKITGKITLGDASDCSIKNLQLETNADYILEDTGSDTGSIRVLNCTLTMADGGAINLDNVNRTVTLQQCNIDRTTDSVKLFNVTTCASLSFEYCTTSGLGSTQVASTIAAGIIGVRYSKFNTNPIVTSGTATGEIFGSEIISSADNIISVDHSSNGLMTISSCRFDAGTSAGLNIGASATVRASGLRIKSSNSDAVSGTGTFVSAGVEFMGTSSTIASGLTWSQGFGNFRALKTTLVQNGATSAIAISTAGEVTNTNQPCFQVEPDGDKDNVTGDATDYTVVFDTEIFDQNDDFDGTSTFTAPVSGRYLLSYTIGAHDFTSSHTSGLSTITTSNRSYNFRWSPYNCAGADTFGAINNSVVADMDASDTCTITYRVSGGTKVVDVGGSGATDFSKFSGCLLV